LNGRGRTGGVGAREGSAGQNPSQEEAEKSQPKVSVSDPFTEMDLDGSLKTLQQIVGGLIEPVATLPITSSSAWNTAILTARLRKR
jgi:hypothetical protein